MALARGRRMDQELEDEIAAHLELAERDAIGRGLSPEEARLAARREFGGVEQMKEDHRDHRGYSVLSNLARDLRYGFGLLKRDPAFATIAITVLAVGIGANLAMFSILDAVLLKPLPYANADRIVRVWEAPRPGSTNSTSTPDFVDWKRLGTCFDALSAETPLSMALSGAGEAARLSGKAVTSDYFRVFATDPLIGRTFTARDDQPGADSVVVLSHATWQTHFGADPRILERRMLLDGESHAIVGVLRPGVLDGERSEFWKALVFTPDQFLRGSHWLRVHGRLRSGVSAAQAQQQMRSIQASLAEVTPLFKRSWQVMVEPLQSLMVGTRLRQSILVASGAVLLVLLIACANVANLLIAKGAARTREISIRAALGASRGRLLAQLITESLVLCVLGGVAGLLLASLLIRTAGPFVSQSLPYPAPLELDLRLFGLAVGMVLFVTLLAGALPSLQTSIGSLERAMRQSGRGSSGSQQGVRRYVVVAEIALSLVLVSGALLLFKSLFHLQQLETGIRIENVITMSLSLPTKEYPTPERAAAFYASATERIASVPGVLEVGLTSHLPLRWIGNGEAVQLPGIEELVNVRFKRVDAGYFETLDIPLREGRGVERGDRNGGTRVVVINEALSKRICDMAGWKSPIGRTVRLHCPRYLVRGTDAESVEVVGVIRNERVANPGMPDPPVVYVPLSQVPTPGFALVVRTQADPPSVVAGIREAIRGLNPNLPLGDIATLQEIREATLSGTSRPAWVIGVFAAIAALLTAIGLYGVLSQVVTQRRREIGIRMALGAKPGDVVGEILRNASNMVVMGLIAGAFGVAALTRVLSNLLFEVSPLDPAALVGAGVSMTLIGLLAGWIPARRAARVDPVRALREDG
jgi:putative ABC transport system permease protein